MATLADLIQSLNVQKGILIDCDQTKTMLCNCQQTPEVLNLSDLSNNYLTVERIETILQSGQTDCDFCVNRDYAISTHNGLAQQVLNRIKSDYNLTSETCPFIISQ